MPVSWHEALAATAAGLRAASGSAASSGAGAGGGVGTGIGVIGGARLTNEGAYAWARLAKGVLGTDSVDAQLGDGLPAELVLGLPPPPSTRRSTPSTVVLLTGDVREELPVLFLRLRGCGPRRRDLDPRAVAPGHLPHAVRNGLAALCPRRGHRPRAFALRAERDRRPLTPRAADGAWWPPTTWWWWPVGRRWPRTGPSWPRRSARWPKPCLGPGSSAACAAGTCTALSTWASPPGSFPVGSALEEGRDWFAAAWGRVPEERGLDTAGMLAAAAGTDGGSRGGDTDGGSRGDETDAGSSDRGIRALVLLGAEPLSDFPDRRLARRALDAAEFVVAVTSQPGAEYDVANVVLPAAEAHERRGTTTNVEGRVSRLGHKLVAPGQAWPDWMIAAELAVHLGSDLGIDSLAAVWDEIERLRPLPRRHHGRSARRPGRSRRGHRTAGRLARREAPPVAGADRPHRHSRRGVGGAPRGAAACRLGRPARSGRRDGAGPPGDEGTAGETARPVRATVGLAAARGPD